MANEQGNAPGGARITPAEIQRQEFGVSRFGGYRMRDVDEFLDRLTESTEALMAENERLRSGAAPIVGTPDLQEVERQADEILRRAREEAARIVGDARNRQAATAVGPVDEGQRAAVDAFLAQERAFLQSLAALVQGHAESVKGMAKRTRQQPIATVGDATAEERPAAEERTRPDVSLPEASDERAEPERETSTTQVSPDATASGDQTVILEAARPAAGTDERDQQADPSLRQLFWGEER